MPSEPVPAERPSFVGSDEDVDAVIELCEGDARAAVRVLILANAALEEEYAALEAEVEGLAHEVSRGYVRARRRPQG
ncbi:MAG: hypothetical protein K0R27_328 [Xanthobacteraceae bacterium]|nr:hypothetical protein [Xanthobacteraceae bacterium]